MSCNCYDPVTFGHQSRRCVKALTFGLDDLDCYLNCERDNETRGQWYTEQARERQKLGIVDEADPWPGLWQEDHGSLLRRVYRLVLWLLPARRVRMP